MNEKIYPCRVTVRCTIKEKKLIKAAAKAAKKNMSRHLVESVTKSLH